MPHRDGIISGSIPLETAVASVTIAKLTEAIALGLFGALGAAAAIPLLAGDSQSRVAVAIAVAIAILISIGFYAITRRGAFSLASRTLLRLGIAEERVRRLAAAAEAVDEEIAQFYASGPYDFALSITWHLIGWLVNVFELWLTVRFLGIHAPLQAVFAMEALAACWDGLFFFVPVKAGSAEGGRVAVLALFGYSAAQGLQVAVARRARELFWTAIGLLLYGVLARRPQEAREAPAVVPETPAETSPLPVEVVRG